MKVIFFANTDWYLYNFRLELLRAVAALDAEIVLLSPPGRYGSMLREQGWRWIPLEMDRRSLNPIAELRLIGSIARLYSTERPDLVHHFTIKPVIYGSLAARLTGVPATVNALAGLGHLFSNQGPAAKSLRSIVCLALPIAVRAPASRLIVQNPDDRDQLVRGGLVDEQRIRLIRGSGVTTSRFKPKQREQTSQPPVVLMATRLLWAKGVQEYVDAARQLRASGVQARFLLAGDPDLGNPAAVPEATIRAWCDTSAIEWLGHVNDVAGLLDEVDIVVLPTRYGEGVPRILIEAASAALPLIATDVPGCREIVEHEVNGLLVPPGEVAPLVEALAKLIAAPQLRSAMGRNGRDKVLSEFDEQIVIRKTLDVYHELLPMRMAFNSA